MTQQERSSLFTAYNITRKLTHQGSVDAKRLNRAFGIAQSSKPAEHDYGTTISECHCPDRVYRLRKLGQPCKHIIAALIRQTAAQMEVA